jgi:hypothetical protein
LLGLVKVSFEKVKITARLYSHCCLCALLLVELSSCEKEKKKFRSRLGESRANPPTMMMMRICFDDDSLVNNKLNLV